MKTKLPLLRACWKERLARPPVWFMRQAGRYMEEYRAVRAKYTIKEISKNPELAAQVTLDPVKKLGVDAAILFSDILLIAEPMGFQLDYKKGEGPAFANPITDLRSIKNIRLFDVHEEMRFTTEALGLIKRALAPSVALIGFAGAPFTLASYLIEGGHSPTYLKTKRLMHCEPKSWHLLMNKLAQATRDYLAAQIEAGADVVQLFDSWIGCLAPQDFKEFVLPHVQSIIQHLKKYQAPVIYFGTGTAGLLHLMKLSGAEVIGADWRIPLGEAWKKIGQNLAIQGNLDPAVLLAPRPIIRRHVLKILDEAQGRPGHIFNLGHGILPETPRDNARYVVELIHGHNRQ